MRQDNYNLVRLGAPNLAPAPNRRTHITLAVCDEFYQFFSVPPPSPAAVGESQRSADSQGIDSLAHAG
jgi:hypothetical protein